MPNLDLWHTALMTNPTLAPTRPVVLVHGAWHGAWCWAALQAELDARGIPSYALDLPGHGASLLPFGGLHHDAAHLGETLDRLALRDAVLVGHSYGGAVITQAAAGRTDLGHLVYLAAFALDPGESITSAAQSFPPREITLSAAIEVHSDRTSTLDPEIAAKAFYRRCTQKASEAALARLCPQPYATLTEAITGESPRARISSTYVCCLQDEAIHPDHQRLMAQRCTERIDLDTDHSPFLSTPAELAEMLARIAQA